MKNKPSPAIKADELVRLEKYDELSRVRWDDIDFMIGVGACLDKRDILALRIILSGAYSVPYKGATLSWAISVSRAKVWLEAVECLLAAGGVPLSSDSIKAGRAGDISFFALLVSSGALFPARTSLRAAIAERHFALANLLIMSGRISPCEVLEDIAGSGPLAAWGPDP